MHGARHGCAGVVDHVILPPRAWSYVLRDWFAYMESRAEEDNESCLDVSSLWQTQWNREANENGDQPSGHVVKLASLLASTALRHVLWTQGQVPAYVLSSVLHFSRPFSTIENGLYQYLDNTGLGDFIAPMSFALDLHEASHRPRLARMDRSWMPVYRALEASNRIESRIHNLFKLLSQPDTPMPSSLRIAFVTGQSLLFPQSIFVIQLEHMISLGKNVIEESEDTEKRRRKVSAMLERRFVRHCMEHDLLPLGSTPISRTRILVLAPSTTRIPGWTPRPHWTLPTASSKGEPSDSPLPPSAYDTHAPTVNTSEPRSRMSLRSQRLLSQQRVSRTPLPRRARVRAKPVYLKLEGGLASPTHVSARDIWFECDTLVSGYRDEP